MKVAKLPTIDRVVLNVEEKTIYYNWKGFQ